MHPLVTTCIVSPVLLFLRHSRDVLCVETENMSKARGAREKLLITTYQEVNDLFRSNTCCDDENVRDGGNTDLPEQHFSLIRKKDIHRNCGRTFSIIARYSASGSQ